ncbi:unnamed protein product [Lota lota]
MISRELASSEHALGLALFGLVADALDHWAWMPSSAISPPQSRDHGRRTVTPPPPPSSSRVLRGAGDGGARSPVVAQKRSSQKTAHR